MTDIEAVDPYAESDAESATDEPSFSPDAEYHKFMWTWVEDMRREFIGTTIARIPHDVLREYLFPMVLHDKYCEWSPGTPVYTVDKCNRVAIPELYRLLKYQKKHNRAMYPISDYVVIVRRRRMWAFTYAGVELWYHKVAKNTDDYFYFEYLGGGIFIHGRMLYYCNKYGLHETGLRYDGTLPYGLMMVTSEDGSDYIWNPYSQVAYVDTLSRYFEMDACECVDAARGRNIISAAPWWTLHQFPRCELVK